MSRPQGDNGWDLADDLVLAAVHAQVLGEAAEPIVLGKYRVERTLGSGAMGRVLLAHDPSLDRSVALKLIAPELAGDRQARERIDREARAMARLSEPHVAQVYEVAEDGPHLFVAMEYVDGQDLRAWLDAEPRSWREIVAVFIQAGQGLAAAHRKDLVHRDFKPENVMLDEHGRARVVDFGLALAPGADDGQPRGDGEVGWIDPRLTATGALLGTPAYMAPEQWRGGTVDARSDQFSFCVALYEALGGARPYEGSTVVAVQLALESGSVAPLPRSARVPRRIERAIRRGLCVDPVDRFATMEPLLRALGPRSRVWMMGVVTGAAVLGAGALAIAGPGEDPCANAGLPMDTVWGPQQRAATERAMLSANTPWAPETTTAVLGRLDVATSGWRQAATAACNTDEVSPTVERCLIYARARLSDTVERLGDGDAAVLVGAAAEVELLADARACLQPAALEWLEDPSADTSLEGEGRGWQAWATAVRSLGEMSTVEGAERYVESMREGRAAADQARAYAEAQGNRALLAHAAWISGRLAMRDGDTSAAEALLREATGAAAQVNASALRAAAAIDLVYLVGNDADRTEEAQALAADAEGTLVGLGSPPIWMARLATHRASTLAHARPPQPDAAEAEHRKALEGLVDLLGPSHPDVIVALGNVGAALGSTRPAQAQEYLRDAVARAERVWGAAHPRTARLQGTLGLAMMHQGQLDEARDYLRRSLDARLAALGADHDEVASARYNLALVLRRQGEHAEAIEQLRLGLAVRGERRGPNDLGLVEWLLPIGVSELAIDRLPDARASLQRALDICELRGATATRFATLRFALARAYAPVDPAKARVLAEQARRAWDHKPSAQQTIDEFIAGLHPVEL